MHPYVYIIPQIYNTYTIVLHSISSLMYVQACFYVDWVLCETGIVRKDGTKSDAKGDFAITLTAMIEAGANTGFLADVKRAIDGERRLVMCKYISMQSMTISFHSIVHHAYGILGASLIIVTTAQLHSFCTGLWQA